MLIKAESDAEYDSERDKWIQINLYSQVDTVIHLSPQIDYSRENWKFWPWHWTLSLILFFFG